jgi:predicted RNA-binding Zn-ribbon protein involved in translation (DUF1610 family)
MLDEIAKFACSDCGTALAPSMTVLTDEGTAMHLACCPRCADHVTVRCRVPLSPEEFKGFYMAGVPVVHYSR